MPDRTMKERLAVLETYSKTAKDERKEIKDDVKLVQDEVINLRIEINDSRHEQRVDMNTLTHKIDDHLLKFGNNGSNSNGKNSKRDKWIVGVTTGVTAGALIAGSIVAYFLGVTP
ncbi:hypothetical protein CL634_01920 [bacterium]|nr:hypothetical protein [bacterium]|tara:strand:- start:3523 stop:3867 length:345 start_codon:yes stop_codon:yes gene_type:complete